MTNFISGCQRASGDHGDKGDESDLRIAIPAASRQPRSATELQRFGLRTSDVDMDEGEHGDDAYADEEEEASPADDGSTQNLEN